MTQIIHVTTEAEPIEIHGGAAGSRRAYAVQIGFEVTQGTEDDAKAAFGTFLDAVKDFTLLHVSVDAGGAATVLDDPVDQLPELAPLPGVAGWLERSRKTYASLEEGDGNFYVSAPRGTADLRNARAADLIRAMPGWPAPLPQRAGILRAVTVPAEPVGVAEYLIAVPPASEETTTDMTVTTDNGTHILKVTYGTGVEHVVRTEQLPELDLAQTALFRPDGTYRVPSNVDAAQRLLTRIEERSPSLLWPATILGSVAQDEWGYDGDDFTPGGANPLALYRWVVKASVYAMFDVILTGLLMPASNTDQKVTARSSVLGRLARFIAGSLEDEDFAVDVDEAAIYAELHGRLWKKLGHLEDHGPLCFWAARPTLDDIDRVLGNKAITVNKKSWPDLLETLSEELGRLATQLESEDGAESWLIALLETLLEDVDGQRRLVLKDKPNADLNQAAVDRGYAAFTDDLARNFNAAEAFRRDFGAEVLVRLLSQNQAPDAEGIRSSVTDLDPMWERFRERTSPVNRLVAATLYPGLVPDPAADILAALTEGMADNLATLVRDSTVNPIFRPDTAPQPLMIPIAHSPTSFRTVADGQSDATVQMAGLAFVIRARRTAVADGDPAEAHINLISLAEAEVDTPDILSNAGIPVTIDPMLPVALPGTAAMYLPYTGLPVGSQARSDPASLGQSPDDRALQALVAEMAPFARGEAVYAEETKLPDLAYGVSYAYDGVWIPPSGVLPEAVRGGDPFTPTLPGNTDMTGSWPCLRRTAIAETGLKVSAAEQPEDIHPIGIDDPRLGLARADEAQPHLDLYRGPDGEGVLNKGDEVKLQQLRHSAGFDVIRLRVEAVRINEDKPCTVAMDGTDLKITLPDDVPEAAWLRLSLPEDGDAAISFSDPAGHKGQVSAGRAAPVVLLAPRDDGWTMPQRREVTVDAPRVCFEDLERWAANETLWQTTCGRTDAERLLSALREAKTVLEAAGHPAARRLNELPDPAVSGLHLTLAMVDRVAEGGDLSAPFTTFLRLAPYAGIDDLPTFDAVSAAEPGLAAAKALEDLTEPYVALLDRIEEAARRTLTLAPGRVDASTASLLRVPEGSVARLKLRPAVKASLFEAAETGKAETGIFDPGMLQLAQGRRGDHVLFDGPALSVEVMTAPASDARVPGPFLQIDNPGETRGYAIRAVLEDETRLYAEAELLTQRWRFQGAPIYDWIDPAPLGETLSGPAVVLQAGTGTDGTPVNPIARAALDAFEGDAFQGRDMRTGLIKRIRLSPGPDATTLDRIQWPERSATYFRHNVRLISRYQAAMEVPGAGIVDRIADEPGERIARAWNTRVALLADPLTAPLTRPQVRAVMPLMRGSGNGKAPNAPAPLTCILSEPPMAQLGLADRFEVTLAPASVFELHGADPQVALANLRKEIGPDPLLSYRATPDDASRAITFRPEGPVGLHFEEIDATAPAWSNAQFMLHMEGATDADLADLDESFAALQMSRFADPAWCWSPALEVPGDGVGITDDLWIPVQGQELTVSDADPALLSVADGRVVVRADALYADVVPDLITLWDGAPTAILLKPLGDQSLRVSVYVDGTASRNAAETANGAADGIVARPRLATSVVLSTRGAVTLNAAGLTAKRIVQSPATLKSWVRSARDQTVIAVGRKGEPDLLPVESLHAEIHEGRVHFHDGTEHRRVALPVAHRKTPLHVHRRLMHVLQEQTRQLGDRVEVFRTAVLADEWGIGILPSAIEGLSGTTVTLAEVECRAEIVRFGADLTTLPAAFDTRFQGAKFDLRAVLPSGTSPGHLRFHIRGIDALNLGSLRLATEAAVTEAFPVNAPAGIGALDVVIFEGSDGVALARLSYVEPDDAPQRPSTRVVPLESAGEPLAFADLLPPDRSSVTLTPTSDAEEVWADISLLASRKAFDPEDPDRFDFDWLFGIDDGDDARRGLPDALHPATLNRLVEAQARLIGLSPAIPVNSHSTTEANHAHLS